MKINLNYVVLSAALTSFIVQAFANERDFSGIECLDVKVNARLKVRCHEDTNVVVKWDGGESVPFFSEGESKGGVKILKVMDQQPKEKPKEAPLASFSGGSLSIIGGQNVHIGNTISTTIHVGRSTRAGSATRVTKKSSMKFKNEGCSLAEIQDSLPSLLEIFLPIGGLTRGVKVNLRSAAYTCDVSEGVMKDIKEISYVSFSGSQTKGIFEDREMWERFSGSGKLKFSWDSFEPQDLSAAVGGVIIREIE